MDGAAPRWCCFMDSIDDVGRLKMARRASASCGRTLPTTNARLISAPSMIDENETQGKDRRKKGDDGRMTGMTSIIRAR